MIKNDYRVKGTQESADVCLKHLKTVVHTWLKKAKNCKSDASLVQVINCLIIQSLFSPAELSGNGLIMYRGWSAGFLACEALYESEIVLQIVGHVQQP